MWFYWGCIMITNYYIKIDIVKCEYFLNIHVRGRTYYAYFNTPSLRNVNKLPYSIIYPKYWDQ